MPAVLYIAMSIARMISGIIRYGMIIIIHGGVKVHIQTIQRIIERASSKTG